MCFETAKRLIISNTSYYCLSHGTKVSLIKPANNILVHGKDKRDPLSKISQFPASEF